MKFTKPTEGRVGRKDPFLQIRLPAVQTNCTLTLAIGKISQGSFRENSNDCWNAVEIDGGLKQLIANTGGKQINSNKCKE